MESRLHGPSIEVDAPYVAEMVRNEMQAKYGDSVYTAGYQVFTTIDSRLEAAATVALRTGLLEYDRRHGWRGATAKVDLSKVASTANLDAELEEFPAVGGLRPAIVQKVEAKSAKIYVKELGEVTLPWEKMSWARRELPDEKVDRSPTQASEIFSRGDVIYTVGNSAESLQFVQVPEAQSALVAVDPKDGAVVALVGGFDFFQSKFNRVTQARRQPGSGFKPFVYAAAFDKGYTPASVVLDAPIVIDEAGMEKAWRPKDFENEFRGPVRLREALVHSRNLVSIRLMREIGGDYTWNYVTRFGFDKSRIAERSDAGRRYRRIEPAAARRRLRHFRQRRLSRDSVLHRSHRGCERQGVGAGGPGHRLLRMRPRERSRTGGGCCAKRPGGGRRRENHRRRARNAARRGQA